MSLTEALPTLNATLNGTATLLLSAGYICIKTGRQKAHRNCMVAAFTVSIVFLGSYVLHKYLLHGVHTPFQGEGFWRTFYYTLLASHIILAMAIVPLVLTTLVLALRSRWQKHRAWARRTYPIWYYVSLSGVLVYFFLYQWF